VAGVLRGCAARSRLITVSDVGDGGAGGDFGGGGFTSSFDPTAFSSSAAGSPGPTPVDPTLSLGARYTPVGPPFPYHAVSHPTPPPGGSTGPGGEASDGPDGPPLLVIGDIVVTRHTVRVPQGTYPLRGTTWTVQDTTQVTEVTPTYAIILAVVFALCCLLGLLFLLVREKRYSGAVVVTVAGEGFTHSTYLTPGPTTVQWAQHQVRLAQALAATTA
jgi:hypothetical protein